MEFQMEKLHTMKRVQLQRICKNVGIKANMKTAKMIEALMQYGCKETQMEKSNERDIANGTAANKMKTDTKDETSTHDQDMNKQTPENKQGKKRQKPAKATSKIPRSRLTASASLKANKNTSTPTASNIQNKTPKSRPKNWIKIHEKQFEKMDSLDVYLNKKRKRAEDLGSSNSVKKVKKVIQKKETKNAGKAQASFKSSTTPKLQQEKSVVKKVDFRRKTLTCNKNLKENAMTPVKQERRATFGVTKSTTESARKPTTPFRFSTVENTMIFSPRNAFDLKASLAKPLSYKPYTGKLPTPTTYAKSEPKIASVKEINTHKRDVKEVKVTTRKERCEQQIKNQSKKRVERLCKRRGIVS